MKIVPYADDSTSYAQGKFLDDLVAYINVEFDRTDEWLGANRLYLNI